MQVQHEAGGTFRVGRLWRGVTREREVRVKESSAAKYCMICRGQPEVDLDLPPEPGARWVANEPERPARPRDPYLTPEVIRLADQLIAGWIQQKVPDLELDEAGAVAFLEEAGAEMAAAVRDGTWFTVPPGTSVYEPEPEAGG